MELGLHLLETCRLRKEIARGAAQAEAEWWERRILCDIEEFENAPKPPKISGKSSPVRESPPEGNALRRCAVCGDEAQIADGLFCENGHFVCAKPECKHVGFFSQIRRAICPICARLLR